MIIFKYSFVLSRGDFFEFSGTYAGGGGGEKNCPKKYNIDYFGYAVNLGFKFKLNFDEEGGDEEGQNRKKVKIKKKQVKI